MDHEAARSDELAQMVDRRYAVARGELSDSPSLGDEHRVCRHHEGIGLPDRGTHLRCSLGNILDSAIRVLDTLRRPT